MQLLLSFSSLAVLTFSFMGVADAQQFQAAPVAAVLSSSDTGNSVLQPPDSGTGVVVNSGFAETGGIPESSGLVATNCGCQTNQCPKCRGRLGAKRKAGITVKDLWNREMPSGNQSLNFPYYTPQLYHYNRPYNTLHIRQSRNNSGNQFGYGNQSYPAHPYSTEVFDEVHKQLSAQHKRPTELGYLEFSDWQRYEAAQNEWERHRPTLHSSRNEHSSKNENDDIRATLYSKRRNLSR